MATYKFQDFLAMYAKHVEEANQIKKYNDKYFDSVYAAQIARDYADVLIHTICDALLGAANMRDIGYHFPDTAGEFKDIDSKILLKKTVELIATKGYSVGNIDATICAERPKLKSHIPAMQQTLAKVMGIDEDDISIKATTTERLGFTGREEGISAYATVLITKE